jgi:hypothetical protein
VQEWIEAGNQEGVLVEYAPYAALMGHRTLINYAQEGVFTGDNPDAAFHRLIKAGFVEPTMETRPYTLDGSPFPHVLTTYRYSPSQQLLDATVVLMIGPVGQTRARMLRVGLIGVDGVSNLTFGRTMAWAHGQFSWHIDYNGIGEAITGNTRRQGTDEVRFRRQAGIWICVRP